MPTIALRNELPINHEVVHLEAIRLAIGNIHSPGSDSPGP
jgi:hypothetical protein